MTVYDSPEYAALLAAVRADFGADLPRLMLADWLDDAGESERAEIIRLMLATPPARRRSRRRRTRRTRNLTGKLLREFGFSAPRDRVPGGWHGQVARGFVEAVTCPAEVWVHNGGALLAREPVQRVTLTTAVEFATRSTFFADIQPQLVSGEWVHISRDLGGDAAMLAALSARWPGVTFTMPLGQLLQSHIESLRLALFRGIRGAYQPC